MGTGSRRASGGWGRAVNRGRDRGRTPPPDSRPAALGPAPHFTPPSLCSKARPCRARGFSPTSYPGLRCASARAVQSWAFGPAGILTTATTPTQTTQTPTQGILSSPLTGRARTPLPLQARRLRHLVAPEAVPLGSHWYTSSHPRSGTANAALTANRFLRIA